MAMASSPALLLQSSTPSSSSSTLTCLYPAVSTVQSIRLPVASPRKLAGGFAVKAELQRLAVERSDAETVNRFQNAYLEKIIPALQEEFAYKNIHQIPKITKITLNCGIGDASQNKKGLDAAMNDLALIAGQRPVKTRAKNANATFKIREGQPLGIAVTLRRKVMWSFLDRLINLGLPRTRDFQGVNPNSFDGHGNYSLGIQEQTIFPELGFESLSSKRGMDVCIVTTAQTDKEAYKLLALMGMPFTEGAGPVVPVVRKKKYKRHHFESKANEKSRR